MAKLFHEADYPIIRSFLEREAMMYRWKNLDNRRKFIDRMFSELTDCDWLPDEHFDYVHIQSLSNMGLVTSELVLTCARWKSGQSLYLCLPPNPRGSLGETIRKGK